MEQPQHEIAIYSGCGHKLVNPHELVRLMGNRKVAGSEHDAPAADGGEMHEVAAAHEPTEVIGCYAMTGTRFDGRRYHRIGGWRLTGARGRGEAEDLRVHTHLAPRALHDGPDLALDLIARLAGRTRRSITSSHLAGTTLSAIPPRSA